MPTTIHEAADGPLAELAARCRRQRLPCALLLAAFRPAPQAGELADEAALAALRSACEVRLRSQVRADDEVHALGGLEFGLLLRRCSAAGADIVAERLVRTCSAPDGLAPPGLALRLEVRRVIPPDARARQERSGAATMPA